MKKQLLLAAFLMGGFFTATAQEISFETSEGYSLGSLDGQNEWGLTQIDEEGTTISGVEVNDVRSTTGTFSLSLAQDEALIQGEEGPFIGAFSPALDSDYNNVTISFDIYVDDIDDDAETGMDFSLMTQSNELALLTSNLYFVFDGRIAIQDVHEGETATLSLIEGVTYNFNAWNSVVIDYDFTAGTITYTLNDEVIFEGTVWNAEALDHLVMFHDNWPGSTVFIDNLIVGETGTTGTVDFAASTLSVFPNPATNVINVTNNEVVNNVQIVDLNGRVVKSAKVNATEAQINISDLSAGVYMMNIATDKGTTTKKIVKN